MAQVYNNPPNTNSTVGEQIRFDYYKEKALRAIRPTQHFQVLADVTSQPRNYGKKIKQYLLLPLLDDANVNNQGINASGVTITDGNLYGSSDDIGNITGKLPLLSETGGAVNRVGLTRMTITAELSFYGFYIEYTKQSQEFDSQKDLYLHYTTQCLQGASEIVDDLIQMDLINEAGTVRYAGAATSIATITGEGANVSELNYDDIVKLVTDLNNALAPTDTKIITGSRRTDTKTINSARFAYCSPDLIPMLMAMTDYHGERAFIEARQYASSTEIRKDEVGAIYGLRIIAHTKAKVHRGAGATVGTNGGFRATGGNYDVYNLLVPCSGSFTCVGFETDGNEHKFEISEVKPGDATSKAIEPQGQIGRFAINWYHASLIQRPTWIGIMYTVCRG